MTLNTEILADSPLHYWRVGEASGNFADSGSGSNTGVSNGAITYGVASLVQSDAGNDAIQINTAGTDYVSLTSAIVNGTNDDWTVEAVLNITAFPVTLIASAAGHYVDINEGFTSFQGSGSLSVNHSVDPALGVPVHFVARKQGTWLYVFADGVLLGSINWTVYRAFTFDQLFTGGYAATQVPLIADEVAFYNTGLSDARILAHYEATQPPTTSLTFEVEVLPDTGISYLGFEIEVYETGSTALTFEIEVTPDTGTTSLGFEIEVYESGTTSLGFEISVYDPAVYSPSWTLAITVDGVDLSSILTGRVEVGGGEQEAALAQFTIKPALGPIDIYSWVNKRVQIDSGADRLFTGYVDRPVYEPSTGLTTLYCTDAMQNTFNNLPADQIDSLLGGYHSKHIFTDDARGWDYAKQHLSTLPKAFDLDANGVGKLTPWAAKATADFTFTEADILSGSLRIDLAQRSKVHNTHLIDFQFRYQRLIERTRAFSWLNETSFVDWAGATTLPTKTMLREAAESTNPRWTLDHENYTHPPKSARIPQIGTDIFWYIKEADRVELLFSADFTLKKRWVQTVTESYAMKLIANQSVEKLGTINQASQFSVTSQEDAEGWEDFTATPAGVSSVNANDKIIDVTSGEISRADADKAMETIQARGKADILQSHRQNRATFKTLFFPWINRTHTAQITTTPATTKGKVRAYKHVFNLLTGSALTEITLALSKSQATGIPVDTPIAPPPEAVKVAPVPADPYLTELATHIGGRSDSLPFDEDWSGFIGNNARSTTKTYKNRSADANGEERTRTGSNISAGSEMYPYQFIIPVPAVETLLTDALEAQADHTVAIAIPEDPLTMQA